MITTGNLFTNPYFDGATRPVIFGEVNVKPGWEPFYCDQPYTPAKCPAEERESGKNPLDLVMGRPEFKGTDVPNRVKSGEAQQWFCFFRACRAGIYQTVRTVPGATCEVTFQVQTWSASDDGGTYGTFLSDIRTEDDQRNSRWRIVVDPMGGTFAFTPGLLASEWAGYEAGHYDKYAELSYVFVAQSDQATIFVENLRLWPMAHNDSYVDNANVYCIYEQSPTPEPTVTPRATEPPPREPTPGPTYSYPTPTPVGPDGYDPGYPQFDFANIGYVPEPGLRLRQGACLSDLSCPVIGLVPSYVVVRCFLRLDNGQLWASPEPLCGTSWFLVEGDTDGDGVAEKHAYPATGPQGLIRGPQ